MKTATTKQVRENVILALTLPKVWDVALAYEFLQTTNRALSKRTVERFLKSLDIFPIILDAENLLDQRGMPPNKLVLNYCMQKARRSRKRLIFAQLHTLPSGVSCLHANDARGARFWIPLQSKSAETIKKALVDLQHHLKTELVVLPHADLHEYTRKLGHILSIEISFYAFKPSLEIMDLSSPSIKRDLIPSQHLRRLEAESIQIIREAVAESQNPVMMYSIGKDSGVMLHLAKKAFYPSKPPFPLLHVDTRWKFQEMYLFRDFVSRQSGMKLMVHINPEAIEKNINPFDHGSAIHTDITKTEGLKQVIEKYKFDMILGGARRDEEKSRAKERVFSFRTATHQWDPKNQRPELWSLYNTKIGNGESIRVFPLSNWTELDIWQYIYQESIPIVPLYFARPRPVVIKKDMIMMVDDDRFRLLPGEEIEIKKVRFRTLGCYPLTGAIESDAETLEDVLLEIIYARQSERQGRKIDTDSSGSMEKKKQHGYF